MSLLPNGISEEEGGYKIQRSLRFRRSANCYLTRTPSVSGNRRTFTFSCWIKQGSAIGSSSGGLRIFESHGSGKDDFIRWNNDNIMMWFTSFAMEVKTAAVYRDPSAWYHLVWRVDTTQATASDRNRLYVNGVQVTSFQTTTYPSQNYEVGALNVAGQVQHIGTYNGSSESIDNYLAEVNFIDGQSLDASYFGETDTDTGAWIAKQYTGTYGTNGFYLNFSNTSSTTALGYDTSGNGNNWTPSNFSLTAGSTYDSITDVPTLTSASAANYATLNPLDQAGGNICSEGNLKAGAYSGWQSARATFAYPSTGKYYWEGTCISRSTGANLGIFATNATILGDYPNSSVGYSYNSGDGGKYNNGSYSAYGATWGNGDVIGVAWDADTGTLSFYKNGTSQGNAWTGLTGTFSPIIAVNGSDSMVANFGQRSFAYTPPTGFKALNTYNLPDPGIKKSQQYFNPVLYTGNGSSGHSITGVGFQPDLVWIKGRSYAEWHALHTSLLGTGKFFKTAEGDSEVTNRPNSLTSYNSDGFTVGSEAVTNSNGQTYVAWNWKLGGSSGSTNTNGSITSSVSASTASGMSVVTYTGTGSAATVGHGLGATPSMVICQVRNQASDWATYHVSCGATAYLNLNETRACTTNSSPWNNTAPTSSVFTVGSSYGTNWPGGNCVAWCFAPIEGFSAFGSYTGNGSVGEGPFVYTGFKPAYLLVKNTSAASSHWVIMDDARDSYNRDPLGSFNALLANLSNAEDTGASGYELFSNGFKLRQPGTSINNSGNVYAYAAFAENPFKYSLAR